MLQKVRALLFDNKGQATIFLALGLTALIGFAAITVDYGYLASQKRSLQNAADSAALAAAWELPDDGKVNSKAKEFAKKNASELSDSKIKAVRQNSNKEVKVDVEHTYNTFFGRVLGVNSQKSATATAEKISSWMGEALPLFNFKFDYLNEDPTAWTKVSPGVNGSILDFYGKGNVADKSVYFEVDYLDGISATMGFDKGNDGLGGGIQIKDGLAVILNNNNKVYLFSLRSDIIQRGTFYVNGDTTKLIPLEDLKNKDVINPNQIVLIEIELDLPGVWKHNNPDIYAKYTGKVFDIMNGEFPTEHLSTPGNASRLIK